MHVFLSFFGWPAGSTWSNVLAMPSCGVLATVFAVVFRDKIGKAAKDWHRRHFGHHDELGKIHERLDAHADLLDHDTPGGLGAVMDEVRRAVTAAESAHEAVKALGVIKQAPRRGATPMQKKATGKTDGGQS